MSYDQKAYHEWEKNCPNATDEDKEAVKRMYATGEEEKKITPPAPTTEKK